LIEAILGDSICFLEVNGSKGEKERELFKEGSRFKDFDRQAYINYGLPIDNIAS
jgi:hypothetical protein